MVCVLPGRQGGVGNNYHRAQMSTGEEAKAATRLLFRNKNARDETARQLGWSPEKTGQPGRADGAFGHNPQGSPNGDSPQPRQAAGRCAAATQENKPISDDHTRGVPYARDVVSVSTFR